MYMSHLLRFVDDEQTDPIGGHEIGKRMDISLAYMDTYYEGPFSTQEIADFCGCSRQRIEKTMKQAFYKIREQLDNGEG